MKTFEGHEVLGFALTRTGGFPFFLSFSFLFPFFFTLIFLILGSFFPFWN